jgi:hypothetical protein
MLLVVTSSHVKEYDPISEILLNLVVDVLIKLIDIAELNGQIKGIVPHLVDDDLSILQYADDTIVS